MGVVIGMGLMSGTSGDGVDAALVRFEGKSIACLASGFAAYPKKMRNDIAKSSRPDGHVELVCRLNVEIGKFFANSAVAFCKKIKFPIEAVAFIGSHGQTIRHQPVSKKGQPSSTLQIGEGAEIAAITGCITVSDFRPADIAAGGQGAPLAPIAHHAIFASKKEDRIVHNIGGISNLTWLPKGGGVEKVTGFDTGPGNSLIDLAVTRFSKGRRKFDAGGKTALKGKVNEQMLKFCLRFPYYAQKPPKSTGRELFGVEYFCELLKRFPKISNEDFLRTLCALTAESAARQAAKFMRFKKAKWILCGGGAFNGAIVGELEGRLAGKCRVFLSDKFGIGVKEVEAALMAVLARRTIKGLPGNLPRVTGARRGAILGKISLPPE
ncbi:MAG: anhydro-N-acetylmuramic acid kinase [Nitrospinota bacterium]